MIESLSSLSARLHASADDGETGGQSTVLSDATSFVRRYHACEALVHEQKGWDLTIALIATDTGEAALLRVCDGQVVELRPLQTPDGSASPCDIVVSAEREILGDILQLRRLPNEPYLFGELTVRGPEPDFLRLDYIVSSLGAGVA
jgi:hypothetical protein